MAKVEGSFSSLRLLWTSRMDESFQPSALPLISGLS
jgi:hypothetical protein